MGTGGRGWVLGAAALGLALGVFLGGCAAGGEGKGEVQVEVGTLVGKYRMDATADEVAEAGGLDALPTLFLADGGRYSLTVEGDVLKGSYVVSGDVVVLTAEAGGEQRFRVEESGYRLVEEGEADPVGFVRLGG